MIENIRINGLGVIEKSSVQFGPHMTVITGETGAGKSMLLESLSLLTGGRAHTRLIRYGNDYCEVDGVFIPRLNDESLIQRVEDAGGTLDDDHAIYIGRKVSKKVSSRAYINGRGVPAAFLAELAPSLVTIHGQSDQHRLLTRHSQQEFLDEYSQAADTYQDYQQAFNQWKLVIQQAEDWEKNKTAREEEKSTLTRFLEDIDALDPQENEDAILRTRIEKLMNTEELHQGIEAIITALYGSDETLVESKKPVSELLAQAQQYLEPLVHYDEELSQVKRSIKEAEYLIQDVAQTLISYQTDLDADPYLLEQSHQRLAQITNLCQHLPGKIESANEMRSWSANAHQRLMELDDPQLSEDAWKDKVNKAREELDKKAAILTQLRRVGASVLEKKVTQEIRSLGMPDSSLRISLEKQDPSLRGYEKITFELQSHPQAPFLPLNEGASGGELSRIMLALEVSQAYHGKEVCDRDSCPTLVFDEVDAGIGGHTAVMIAERLADLAKYRQVIAVSHLPQVAAVASQHLVVEKNRGKTIMTSVNGLQRVKEIARMLSGDTCSSSARKHANELLRRYHPREYGAETIQSDAV